MTDPREWTFPASFAQERVWIANQLDAGSPVYNVSVPWLVPGRPRRRQQVTAVFAEVVARHEALRTHLRVDDGTLVQVVPGGRAGRAARSTTCATCPPTSAPGRDAEIAEELARTADPAGRAAAVAGPAGPAGRRPAWRLLLVVHHAVFDSHSAVLFGAEMAALSPGRG